MEELKIELQEKVEAYLSNNGIKKQHLAALLGIHRVQLYNWFCGKYRLNNSQMKILEDFLAGKK